MVSENSSLSPREENIPEECPQDPSSFKKLKTVWSDCFGATLNSDTDSFLFLSRKLMEVEEMCTNEKIKKPKVSMPEWELTEEQKLMKSLGLPFHFGSKPPAEEKPETFQEYPSHSPKVSLTNPLYSNGPQLPYREWNDMKPKKKSVEEAKEKITSKDSDPIPDELSGYLAKPPKESTKRSSFDEIFADVDSPDPEFKIKAAKLYYSGFVFSIESIQPEIKVFCSKKSQRGLKNQNRTKKLSFHNTRWDVNGQNESRDNIESGTKKYEAQKYRLFSLFDDGIQVDEEGWFSVTPEKIAIHHAKKLSNPFSILLDPFCGCAGDGIQFARHSDTSIIIGSDNNIERLLMAKNNAAVYGVDVYMDFILCDFNGISRMFRPSVNHQPIVDTLFLSPPWGGPLYLSELVFSLDNLPISVDQLLSAIRNLKPKRSAVFLPRNSDPFECAAKFLRPGETGELEQNFLNSKFKTLTLYLGDIVPK